MTGAPDITPAGAPRATRAWAVALTAPVAQMVQLIAAYAIAGRSCARGVASIHVVTLVCFVIAATATGVAWRHVRAFERAAASGDSRAWGRVQLLARLGALTGALFTLAIAAQWIAAASFTPCPGTA